MAKIFAPKTCPCGEEFIPTRSDCIYHSRKCQRSFERERARARGSRWYVPAPPMPLTVKVCKYDICHTYFETRIAHQVYCSTDCREADHERKRLAEANSPLSLRFMVLARDGFRCRYCGRGPKDGAVLQVEHVVPRNRKGVHRSINLRAACEECNLGKGGDVLISEHRKKGTEVVDERIHS